MTLAHTPRPPSQEAPDELPGWPRDRVWGLAPEVAAALGCHRQTVYKMARAGVLPARPHGLHGWRFHRDDVLRLMRSQGAPAPAPAAQEPRPLERILALLDALTEDELFRVCQEAGRRGLVRRAPWALR